MPLSAKNLEVDKLLERTTPTEAEALSLKNCQAAFVKAFGEKGVKMLQTRYPQEKNSKLTLAQTKRR